MEFGLYTFADVGPEIDPARRLHNLLEEIELADQLGLDVFGVGEHHRPDYAVSSPAVALAAAAARTRDIRLTSAVTVLSSDDPVRVFQDFATLDLISDGRAEIMAGRGSFIESFPLFGYDLGDYDELFSEKLELLLRLRESERVTWSGKHRAPLEDAGVYPRPLQDPLPVWIAVGGTPQSVVRAALLGLPLAIAIIGGQPEHFAPLTRLYREAARKAGHDPAQLPVSINSHTYVAETSQQASDEYLPTYAAMMNRIGRAARLVADGPQAVRDGSLAARSAPRRQPGGGRTENPLRARALRPQALYGADQRRCDAAREGAACHRAVRHRGSPRCPQGDRAPIHLERRRTGSQLRPARGSTPMADKRAQQQCSNPSKCADNPRKAWCKK